MAKPSFREKLFRKSEENLQTLKAEFFTAAAMKDHCDALMAMDDLQNKIAAQRAELNGIAEIYKDRLKKKTGIFSVAIQIAGVIGVTTATIMVPPLAPIVGWSALSVGFGTVGIAMFGADKVFGRKKMQAIKDCAEEYTARLDALNTVIELNITDRITTAAQKKTTLFQSPSFKTLGESYGKLSKQFVAALADKQQPAIKKTPKGKGFKY